MRFKIAAAFLITAAIAAPEVVDRIAITVNSTDLIKDSDINRDLLATQLLNGEAPNLSLASRKKDAAHLIDQVFIREEIRDGAYPEASDQDAQAQVDALIKQHYGSRGAFEAVLKKYNLTEPDLVAQFQWQLTVLQFIDVRFRPGVLITEDQVNQFYTAHLSELKRHNPKGGEDDLKSEARDTLTGEQVNKLLFTWLDQRRQGAKVRYLEESLT